MELIELKKEVIDSFVNHELGNNLTLSDKVYDAKLARIKELDPDFNIYDYKPIDEDSEEIEHRSELAELTKEYTHNIEEEWIKEDIRLPKYDGSDIVIYYTNGKLSHVLSMSDKQVGLNKTERFKDFVPSTLPKNISYLRCEVLIDYRDSDNARGKANGLVNSKYLQDEIDEVACIVCFAAYDLNNQKIPYSELASLTEDNLRPNGRPKFMISFTTNELTLLQRGVCGFNNERYDFQFAIDGVVLYDTDFAYKLDYLESALTKVVAVNYRETDREGFFPTIEVEPVELDGKTITNPSSNGIPNMVEMGIGIGSVVEVIFSGLTIPKIIDVVNKEEPVLPVCPHCGHKCKLPDDLYGSVVKCSNPDCPGKYEHRARQLRDWIETDKEVAIKFCKDNIGSIFPEYLNIARWNPDAKILVDRDDANKAINKLIEDNNEKGLIDYIEENYRMSELQMYELELNLRSTLEAFKDIMYV